MRVEDLIREIPITTYYVAIDTKNKKIVDLKFFSFGKYTNFGIMDNETAISYIDKNDFLKEVDELVKYKSGDVLFLYHRFYEKDKKHFIYVKVRLKILKIEDGIYYCVGVNEDISKEKENESIVKKIELSPHIGFVIYDDFILYANDFVIEKFKRNIVGDSIQKLVSLDKKMLKRLKKRLNGQSEPFFKENLEIKNHNSERYFINIFTDTIYFNKKYAGMCLCIDNTIHKKREIIEKIIQDINNKRLELFRKDKYKRKTFIKNLIDIFEKEGYEISIFCKKIKYGNTFVIPKDEIVIDNNGKSLYFKISDGYININSAFINEFENKLINSYKELKNVIELTLDAINKQFLLKILQTAVHKSFQWVLITDKKGKIIYVNDSVLNISGYKYEELIGKLPSIFKSDFHDSDFYKNLWKHLKNNKPFEATIINRHKNGSLFYLKTKIIPIEVDGEQYFVSLGIDITKEKELQKSIIYDELTNLYNRKGFIIEAEKKIKRDESFFALILIDIRNFKALNQVKGNIYGDLILRNFSNFLETFFYDEDIIGRVGSDEFAVLLKVNDINTLLNLVENMINKIKKLNEISVNIGIAIYPKDATNIHELIEKASVALEFAKKEGENTFEIYNSSIKKEMTNIIEAKNIIYEALQKNLFKYYFQPYYDIKNKNICGAEALIRIVKDNKIISPGMFIDYAEKSGLIKMIESKMYNKIPFYIKELKIPISFNFSANSFKDKKHIISFFENNKYPLTIELTEREISSNIEYTKEIFEYLKSKQLKIAIDDFGTGYSTFTYIKELDFDILKIDMSFIKNITTNQKDYALVKVIINLAKDLGLVTIAEGVETREQLKILEKLGCDIVQGYLISKPLPFDEMKEFLETFSGLD